MTLTVFASRAARGVRTYRHGSRPSRQRPAQFWGVRVDASTVDSARYVPREDDLNYYYVQVEMFWLAGLATTFERIRDHLPPTERANLSESLAAMAARCWLKLQEIPVSGREDQPDYEKCYVPVRTTCACPSAETPAAR